MTGSGYIIALGLYYKMAAVLVLAAVLYATIAWIFLYISEADTAADYIVRSYFDDTNTNSILQQIYARGFHLFQSLYLILFGWWYNFGLAKYIFLTSVIFCATCIMLRSRRSLLQFVVTGLMIGSLLVTPAALVLVSGGQMPLRTFVAAPMALMMLFLLAYNLSAAGLLRNTIVVFALLFVMQSVYIQSVQQARAWVTQRHDLLLAGALNRDILSIVSTPEGSKIKLDFYGKRVTENVYPRVPTTTIGESFFEWGDGIPLRMVRFIKSSGLSRYQPISTAERMAVEGVYSTMPVWPKPGSIRAVEGIVLVKLSE